MTIKNYKKKPVVIQAIQWTGKNLREITTFIDDEVKTNNVYASDMWDAYCDMVDNSGLKIHTLEGKMNANVGDYIIRGVQGEFYPCKPDIFEKTYEEV